MSDAKPFAVAEGVIVEAAGRRWANTGVTTATHVAAALNAAVDRERREAAAEALEEAAKKWPKGRGKFDSGDFGLWLEAEAAALRKGEA